MNLHRLAPGAESYYLDQVVSGIEDYYSEEGEAPGYWLASSHQLVLEGLVRPEDLQAVLTGLDPRTRERLHRAKNRKVPGWAADGRWRTIDATALYEHAKTGGYVYQAELRHELSARLGLRWTPVHDGLADVAGVDPELIGLFSKRREQIERTMAEWGLSSARAAQLSTLLTRRAKVDAPMNGQVVVGGFSRRR